MSETLTRQRRSVQAPDAVVMIRPHHFQVNTETAADNAFQSDQSAAPELSRQAYDEITKAAETLESHGVRVHLFEDTGKETPDSVFPNNWFSTHAGGHIAIYPMHAVNRRKERRADIIEFLKRTYRVQDIIDYSGLEPDLLFLEGTGAMVLDHIDRVAYAAESNRTDPIALERFCTHFNFEPMAFASVDAQGKAIYHSNVMMCIATEFAMVGLTSIVNPMRRDEVADRLARSGRDVISLSHEQISEFAGNAIELQGREGRLLALSSRALKALTAEQKVVIERTAQLLPLDIPSIELAGGSVRCTLAGVHLTRR
ncbi:citrulline utilization hydrolase CtlX [Polycladidibacter hongkongensis]|uniref:citrulline utilization hydrolase CtlX n=1 Tax=Polycladidibacter hongkongensis TaxID=1647556 RepID=UPI000AB02205|nr:arginine deiminase-related protein [Pseudovibrio hongkongensis]